MDEFHEGVEEMYSNKRKFLKPFMMMFMSATCQIAVVYFSFVAIGETVNPGAMIFAFTLTNIAGVISVIPGDVGVHEGAMIFALSYVGVEEEVAIAATLLYRVYNKFILLGIGFFFYSKFLKPNEQEALAKEKTTKAK